MPVTNVNQTYNTFVPKEKTKGNGTLTMDGFMQLMAAQMQNQDMANPMDNAQMMAQLTQMATVQAMNTFTDLASTQYAMSMIGQDVKLFTIDATGNKVYIYGKVAGIDLNGNKIYLENDKSNTSYGIGNIMEVGVVPKKEEAGQEEEDGGKTESSTPDQTPGTETKPDDSTKPGTTETPGADSKIRMAAQNLTEKTPAPAKSSASARSSVTAKSSTAGRTAAADLMSMRTAASEKSNAGKNVYIEPVTDKIKPIYEQFASGLEEKLAMRERSAQPTQGMIEKLGDRIDMVYRGTGPAAEIYAKMKNPSAKI